MSPVETNHLFREDVEQRISGVHRTFKNFARSIDPYQQAFGEEAPNILLEDTYWPLQQRIREVLASSEITPQEMGNVVMNTIETVVFRRNRDNHPSDDLLTARGWRKAQDLILRDSHCFAEFVIGVGMHNNATVSNRGAPLLLVPLLLGRTEPLVVLEVGCGAYPHSVKYMAMRALKDAHLEYSNIHIVSSLHNPSEHIDVEQTQNYRNLLNHSPRPLNIADVQGADVLVGVERFAGQLISDRLEISSFRTGERKASLDEEHAALSRGEAAPMTRLREHRILRNLTVNPQLPGIHQTLDIDFLDDNFDVAQFEELSGGLRPDVTICSAMMYMHPTRYKKIMENVTKVMKGESTDIRIWSDFARQDKYGGFVFGKNHLRNQMHVYVEVGHETKPPELWMSNDSGRVRYTKLQPAIGRLPLAEAYGLMPSPLNH